MRKLVYYILGVLIAFGCHRKEEILNPPVPDTFSIDCSSRNICYSGGSFIVNVTSYKQWQVETDRSWISTDIYSGEGSEKVTITVEASKEKEARSGTVFFTQETDTLQVDISQELAPFIELATDFVEVDGDGGTFDILFLANTAVGIKESHNWIRLINVSSSNILSFEVLRNSLESREGLITLYAESDQNISKTLKIRQGEKVPHPSISFEEGTEMEVTDDNGFNLHPLFEDMTDFVLVWTSSDTSIASVDDSGRVTVHRTGNCTITAKNLYHNVSSAISLNIKLKVQDISIMFGNQDVTKMPVSSRFVDEKIPVLVTVTPNYAYAEDFVYFSSNSEVADFEGNVLHCRKSGKTEIYVESAFNDIHFKFTVLVIDAEN